MTTRFALTDIVSAQSISAEWDVAAPAFERFMNRELLDQMKIRRTLGDCFLEAEKYGTMIGKVGYERVIKTSVRQIGDREEEFDVVLRDGAQFNAVQDARFLMPFSSQDPQDSPWCGEEHNDTPYRIRQLEAGGLFRKGTIIDGANWKEDPKQESKLHNWINRVTNTAGIQSGNDVKAQQEKLERTEPVWPKEIDWCELYLPWDIDRTGILKEIVLMYHYDSRTIMSCRYNWYRDLRRPYRMNVYFPVEHRSRGIGLCKMGEQFQKEITTQHRQRLDNATLANMRMLKINKMSGYTSKEAVFPGKKALKI